jgi:hypothetical protein
MSAAMDPRDPALNYVVVRGIRSPGRAQFSGVEAPYNWEVLKGYALSGASVIFRGRDIAKPTLTVSLWDPLHFLQWELFKGALKPPTPTSPFFVDMSHPILAAADIKAVGVESLGEPIRQPGGGLWVATIKLIEYRPFKLALVKPDKSIPAVDKGKVEPPKTAGDKFLVDAMKDVSDAMNGGRTKK